MKIKHEAMRRRHEFLLTFFDDVPHYQTKEVNGYLLVKQWNGGSRAWEVAIHTKETYANVLRWQDQRNEQRLVGGTAGSEVYKGSDPSES